MVTVALRYVAHFYMGYDFQSLRPSCCRKNNSYLSYLLRGVHDASGVPLKGQFVLAKEGSDLILVICLESPPEEALFHEGVVSMSEIVYGSLRIWGVDDSVVPL